MPTTNLWKVMLNLECNPKIMLSEWLNRFVKNEKSNFIWVICSKILMRKMSV